MPGITSYNMAVEMAKKKDAIGAACSIPTSTTTALTDKANAINTTGKYANKLVINSTTGNLLYAAGPLAADVWKKTADGTTAQTPV
jgi:hypothetical protein